jgi:hypothetical protein
MVRIPDTSRTSRNVSEGPQAEISRIGKENVVIATKDGIGASAVCSSIRRLSLAPGANEFFENGTPHRQYVNNQNQQRYCRDSSNGRGLRRGRSK